MSGDKPHHFYSVWNNKDDSIIAIDETATVCAELMGITRQRFYAIHSRPTKKWTIMITKRRKKKR